MKNTLLILFLSVSVVQATLAQSDSIRFISDIKILGNHYKDNVYGIAINYDINFNELKSIISNDSIMSLSKFTLNVTFSENKTKIKPALGFDKLKNGNANLAIYQKYGSFDFNKPQPIAEVIFIPLAAFDLSEGEHLINVLIGLNGEDAFGNKYKQEFIEKDIIIRIKKTHTITFNIDYIEVNEMTPDKKVWDIGLFNSFIPDVAVKIMLANTVVWTDAVHDAYIYAKGPKSKNIRFLVSDGDNIRFRVEDNDVFINDFIGEITIPINDANVGKTYLLNKQFHSVKDCVVTYKIE